MLIGSMSQVVWRVWLLVYLSAFVALFCAVCSLYLAGAARELRGTGGYVRTGRMVVLYNFSLLC